MAAAILLLALGEQTQQMMDQYFDRQTRPELRPPGARLVTYLHLAYPQERPFGRLHWAAAPPDADEPGEVRGS